MKYCSTCGAELHDEAIFCHKCGCTTKTQNRETKEKMRKAYKKSNKLFDKKFGFDDIGNRYRKRACFFLKFYKIFIAICWCICAVISIIFGILTFGVGLAFIIPVSLLCFWILWLVHFWCMNLYARGDIYDAIISLKQQTNTDKYSDSSDKEETNNN